MIHRNNLRGAALAATLALTAGLGAPAFAQDQPLAGGTSGEAAGPGVSASTYGSGYTDGQAIGVEGGGAATVADGGTAETDSSAKLNDHMARQRATAMAKDDDERARSRTRTMVREGERVRSTTSTFYKQKGERPVRERVTTVTTPEGTTTTTR